MFPSPCTSIKGPLGLLAPLSLFVSAAIASSSPFLRSSSTRRFHRRVRSSANVAVPVIGTTARNPAWHIWAHDYIARGLDCFKNCSGHAVTELCCATEKEDSTKAQLKTTIEFPCSQATRILHGPLVVAPAPAPEASVPLVTSNAFRMSAMSTPLAQPPTTQHHSKRSPTQKDRISKNVIRKL